MLNTTNESITIPTLPGQEIHAAALGNFAGATVTLQTYVDGAYRAVPNGVYTEPFELVRVNGPGTHARLVVTDAAANTSLSITLTSIP